MVLTDTLTEEELTFDFSRWVGETNGDIRNELPVIRMGKGYKHSECCQDNHYLITIRVCGGDLHLIGSIIYLIQCQSGGTSTDKCQHESSLFGSSAKSDLKTNYFIIHTNGNSVRLYRSAHDCLKRVTLLL